MSANEMWDGSETIDWDAVSDEPLPPPEDGLYQADFAEVKFQKTKQGKPGMSIQLKLARTVDGEDAKGRKLFDNVTFTIESAFKVKQLSKATGVPLPSPVTLESIEEFAGNLIACGTVYVRTKKATYQGKTNAKVDRYLTEEQAQKLNRGEDPSAEVAPEASSRRRRAS